MAKMFLLKLFSFLILSWHKVSFLPACLFVGIAAEERNEETQEL